MSQVRIRKKKQRAESLRLRGLPPDFFPSKRNLVTRAKQAAGFERFQTPQPIGNAENRMFTDTMSRHYSSPSINIPCHSQYYPPVDQIRSHHRNISSLPKDTEDLKEDNPFQSMITPRFQKQPQPEETELENKSQMLLPLHTQGNLPPFKLFKKRIHPPLLPCMSERSSLDYHNSSNQLYHQASLKLSEQSYSQRHSPIMPYKRKIPEGYKLKPIERTQRNHALKSSAILRDALMGQFPQRIQTSQQSQELMPWQNFETAITKSLDLKEGKARQKSAFRKKNVTSSRQQTPGFIRPESPFPRPIVVRSNRSSCSQKRIYDQSNYSSTQSRNSKANFASRKTNQFYSSNTSEHMSFANPEARTSLSKFSRQNNAQSFLSRVEVASHSQNKARKIQSEQEEKAAAPSSGRTGRTPANQPRDIKNITFGTQFRKE